MTPPPPPEAIPPEAIPPQDVLRSSDASSAKPASQADEGDAAAQPAANRPIPRAGFQTLRNRLRMRSVLARKLAVMDLIRRQDEFGRDAVHQVLRDHLAKEDQDAIRQRIAAALQA